MSRIGRLGSKLIPNRHWSPLRSGAAKHFNRSANHLPEAREPFQKAMSYCASTNPRALRFIVLMMGIYLHIGPLSRNVIAEMDSRIAAQDFPQHSMPPAIQEAQARAAF